jgi:fido (protein-threonine AMPylation protein)
MSHDRPARRAGRYVDAIERRRAGGVVPSYITLRGELNEAEQANILEAHEWAISRRRNVLDKAFLNTLH